MFLYLTVVPENIVLFDTDKLTSYKLIRDSLKQNNLYNKLNISYSYSGLHDKNSITKINMFILKLSSKKRRRLINYDGKRNT